MDTITKAVENTKTPVTKLRWKLNEEIMQSLEEAYEVFRSEILGNETKTLIFDQFGGQFIKDSNMSPDAFVQIALQLAYYKMFGKLDATYESAATKQFLRTLYYPHTLTFVDGRTETVRTVSNEALAFCKATCSPLMVVGDDKRIPPLYTLLLAATNAHVRYMREAKEGKGVDRHLFGLRMLFEAQNSSGTKENLPIFADPAYKKSSHWSISTSHCGSPSLCLFGFGPVVADGFGNTVIKKC
jgi:carnitine O-acetyltransferase